MALTRTPITPETSPDSDRLRRRLASGFALIAICASFSIDAAPPTFRVLAGSPPNVGVADGPGLAAAFCVPDGLAVDAAHNIYVADGERTNHSIRRIAPDGTVTTLAGVAGQRGYANGKGALARFAEVNALAFDPSGNLVVADGGNGAIRRVTLPGGVVSTVAGVGGVSGYRDGPAATALFNRPTGVAVDPGGTIYVADSLNCVLRMIDPLGNVSTLAGQPGVCGPATDGSGSAALFGGPTNLRIHPTTGDLYVVDNDYCALYCIAAIRKVTPGGAVTTVVPSGGLLLSPWGLTIDGSGNFYVTDEDSSAVYKYDPAFSGSVLAGNPGVPGIQNGVGTGAGFGCPEGITLDPFDGSLVVSDCSSHDIRRIALPSATVSRVAGRPPLFGNANGSGTGASFSAPVGIAGFGTDLYVADRLNCNIRQVTTGGSVSTLAGPTTFPSTCAWTDGPVAAARFQGPWGVATSTDGLTVYVAETRKVRTISAGTVATIAGGASAGNHDSVTGTTAKFRTPRAVAVGPGPALYVADSQNRNVRKVDLLTAGFPVSTLAGPLEADCTATICPTGSVDGTGSAARFNNPSGIAVDPGGNVFVADSGNATIRKITPSGVVTTIAGSAGKKGTSDGTGSAARFAFPAGLGWDGAGNLLIVDQNGPTLRRMTPAGVVTTIAGIPTSRGSDDGTADFAPFSEPWGVWMDAAGRYYVTDWDAHSIRIGVPGLDDRATIDAAVAPPGAIRQLGESPATGTTWSWAIERMPWTSTATLSSPVLATPTILPDVDDLFVFRLTTTGAGSVSSTTKVSLQTSSTPPTQLLGQLKVTHAGPAIQLDWGSSTDPKHGSYRVYESTTTAPRSSATGSFPGDPFYSNYDASLTQLILPNTQSGDLFWLVTDVGPTGAVGPSGSYGY